MSGRDLRNFVTNHRNSDSEKLVQRVKDGFYSSKYKEVDYAKLKALAAEKKFKGQEKLIKVKKLQEVSKQGKEQNLMHQHRMVWQKEFNRLNSQRNHTQAEVDSHVRQNADTEILGQIYSDFEAYEGKLERDLVKFKEGTTSAVWNLRDDLKIWLDEYSSGGLGADIEDPSAVMETINYVKVQQQKVMEKLHHEQRVLEEELNIGELPILTHLPPEKSIQTGIPEEAFNLYCPDLDMKASVLQEFILLDQKYIERQDTLQDEHQEAIESPTGYWSEADHYVFLYVIEQYRRDISNQRMLYIDRLQRHLPDLTRAQIVAHEEWWTMYKYYFERRRDLISDWLRDRTELLNRAKNVFAEVAAQHEQALHKEENQQKQQLLCEALYNKVREWRERKLEAMQLEHEYLEQRRQERLEVLRQEEERERAKRQQDKDKILAYQQAQVAERRKKELEQKARLQVLKKQLAEQAEFDRERVAYRETEVEKKREELLQKQADARRAAEEREEVLEKIREKVRPHVQGDLLRLWSDTEAWQARLKGGEEFINIQKPLFEINTFTSNKVAADPRFRLAEKLHAAGLSQNPYAQHVMSTVQPLHPPRRDMESSVFK